MYNHLIYFFLLVNNVKMNSGSSNSIFLSFFYHIFESHVKLIEILKSYLKIIEMITLNNSFHIYSKQM